MRINVKDLECEYDPRMVFRKSFQSWFCPYKHGKLQNLHPINAYNVLAVEVLEFGQLYVPEWLRFMQHYLNTWHLRSCEKVEKEKPKTIRSITKRHSFVKSRKRGHENRQKTRPN